MYGIDSSKIDDKQVILILKLLISHFLIEMFLASLRLVYICFF